MKRQPFLWRYCLQRFGALQVIERFIRAGQVIERAVDHLTEDIILQGRGQCPHPTRLKRVVAELHGRKTSDHFILALFGEKNMHVFHMHNIIAVKPDSELAHGPPALLRPFHLVL